jgi:type II secretory pathway component PulF
MKFEYVALNENGVEIKDYVLAVDLKNAVSFLKDKNLFPTKLTEIKPMNLALALKTKNRLAGEMVRQQAILQRENARRNDSVSKINCKEVWEKYLALSVQLGELKGKITQANINVYPMLERMAELKSRISVIQSLPKRVGNEVEYVGGDVKQITYTWSSFIDQEKCDIIVAELQTQINDLQDQIDNYNATTMID